jgi:hypothetical protein
MKQNTKHKKQNKKESYFKKYHELTGSIQGHGALLNGLHFFSSSPEMLSS